MSTMRFHRKCGDRISLLNDNSTAVRNFVEFNHGLILSAEPLKDDVVFEVSIDRKVNVWNGSLEIGVTTQDPDDLELPATATKLRNTAWIMSGSSIVKDGVILLNGYGPELDSLHEGDSLGVMRSSKAELMFYINGRCLGVAAKDMPLKVFGVIDLYGQCVQVTIITTINMGPNMQNGINQGAEDPNNDETLAAGELDEACGFLDETYTKESNDMFVPMSSNAACAMVALDRLRFHSRCGVLVKLSSGNKSAERARPLDDYNNGVVMTHRPLYEDELFEIRIDKLVEKWSGSLEVGVTVHNPETIKYPSTMTNMDTGTIMMSGCKVLVNGHGTCMEYGSFNLDELKEGDTVGMLTKGGKLHYFINGIDQGCATNRVEPQVWGVIDLYGMTVKVTIIDGDEELEPPNLHGTHCTPPQPVAAYRPPQIPEDSLLFHTLRDSNVIIVNDGKTAHRPNAFEFFNNGIVMTNRTLKTNELFQVRLDLVLPKWAGSIEIGVTQHSCYDIEFPFKMSTAKSKTWAMTGEDVIRDGSVIIPQYVRNLNKLVEGNTVGVMRKDMGILHFFVNGVDQGPAAFNIPEHVFGIIDLYGRVGTASIVDYYFPPPTYSPESPNSSFNSGATVLPEMCFHRVHGRNARLSRNRLTSSRTAVFGEFNDAVLFSSRPLRECEMFEIRIDKMVDCWVGNFEIGVTAIQPDLLEANGGGVGHYGKATDLAMDTYVLSGSTIMKDGESVRGGYNLNLDTLTIGSRVGLMWHADRSLHYYLDGMDQGRAWYVPHLNIYAVVDLYGQCTQVTMLQNEERQFNYNGYYNGDTSYLINAKMPIIAPPAPYCFSEYSGDNVRLLRNYSYACRRVSDPFATLVFSAGHLALNEMFEIKISKCNSAYAGGLRAGVTDINILNVHVNRCLPAGIKYLPHYTAYIDGRYMKYSRPHVGAPPLRRAVAPSLEWLHPGDRVGFKKVGGGRVLVYFNSEMLDLPFENVPDKVYVVMELYGCVTKIQSISKFLGKGVPLLQPTGPLPAPLKVIKEVIKEVKTAADGTAGAEAGAGGAAADVAEGGAEAGAAAAAEATAPRPRPYSYYHVHGDNIKLYSSDTVAVRFEGYQNGVAIASMPIKRGRSFRFRVDKIDGVWSGSVATGAVAELPEGPLPPTAAELPPPAWIINSELLNNNGIYSHSTFAAKLEDIEPNAVLSLHFRFNGDLVLDLEGKVLGTIASVPRQYKQIYPVIDLYGMVNQVSILLHPYIVTRGASLDLPIIKESVREELLPDQEIDEDDMTDPSSAEEVEENVCCATYMPVVPVVPKVHKVYKAPKVAEVPDVPELEDDELGPEGPMPVSTTVSQDLQDEAAAYPAPKPLPQPEPQLQTESEFDPQSELELDPPSESEFALPLPECEADNDSVLHQSQPKPKPLFHPLCQLLSRSRAQVQAEHRAQCQLQDTLGLAAQPSLQQPLSQSQSQAYHQQPRLELTHQSMLLQPISLPQPIPLPQPQALPQHQTQARLQQTTGTLQGQFQSQAEPQPQYQLPFQRHAISLPSPENNRTVMLYDFPPYPHPNDAANRFIQRNQIAHVAPDPLGEDFEDDSLTHTFLLRLMLEEESYFNSNGRFDTNIQHNHRFPEAGNVDLEHDLMEQMPFELDNLPDLEEEEEDSLELALRRDAERSARRERRRAERASARARMQQRDIGPHSLSRYLRLLLAPVRELRPPVETAEAEGPGISTVDALPGCEHTALVLKYWKFVWSSQPEMRAAMHMWGQFRCYCPVCKPASESDVKGWVAIERKGPRGESFARYLNVERSILTAPTAMDPEAGPVRRPRAATPGLIPAGVDIWFDEEGNPHRVALALQIEAAADPNEDRLRAFLVHMQLPPPRMLDDTSDESVPAPAAPNAEAPAPEPAEE